MPWEGPAHAVRDKPLSAVLTIGGREIGRGSRQTVELQLPQFFTHMPAVMAARVVRGQRDGPCLFVNAGIHGDEINGVEIIRRLIRSSPLKHLRGTLIAVPLVNIYGFVHKSRYLPDRRDLNRSFPGSVKGSLAARLANAFIEEVVAKSTHGIDLHTGAVHRENLPQIRGTFEETGEVERMAMAFGSPVILNSQIRDGSLREAASELGVPVIVYEGGEALRFDEVAIRAGVRGVISVMRELGMLRASSRPRSRRRPEPVVARSSQWARAPQSGILRAVKPLGARVSRNDCLGLIADPLGDNEAPVLTPVSGVIIGKVNLPLVNEGEALYHIARFGRPDTVAEAVEQFQTEIGPESDNFPPEELPVS